MKAFSYTLDVLIALTIVSMSLPLIPYLHHTYTAHDLELMANTLLDAADVNGTLQEIVVSQSSAQQLVNRLPTFSETNPYCGKLMVYKVNSNSISPEFNVSTNNCALPDGWTQNYTTSRIVLRYDSSPPSGTDVYGVRLLLWPKPS